MIKKLSEKWTIEISPFVSVNRPRPVIRFPKSVTGKRYKNSPHIIPQWHYASEVDLDFGMRVPLSTSGKGFSVWSPEKAESDANQTLLSEEQCQWAADYGISVAQSHWDSLVSENGAGPGFRAETYDIAKKVRVSLPCDNPWEMNEEKKKRMLTIATTRARMRWQCLLDNRKKQ